MTIEECKVGGKVSITTENLESGQITVKTGVIVSIGSTRVSIAFDDDSSGLMFDPAKLKKES